MEKDEETEELIKIFDEYQNGRSAGSLP